MPDIAMCDNKLCEKKEQCRRSPASGTRPDPLWQTLIQVPDWNTCDMFWKKDKGN